MSSPSAASRVSSATCASSTAARSLAEAPAPLYVPSTASLSARFAAVTDEASVDVAFARTSNRSRRARAFLETDARDLRACVGPERAVGAARAAPLSAMVADMPFQE